MKKTTNKTTLVITAMICATIVAVSVVGGLIYMQKQNLTQKDQELEQKKQLTEYEQQQINDRASEREHNDRMKGSSSCKEWFTGC